MKTTTALSFEDCSAWHFATKLNGVLLTGDSQLRKHSQRSRIEVHRILFVFDQLLINSLISYSEALEKLNLLCKNNKWLPKKEIEKRLIDWAKKIS